MKNIVSVLNDNNRFALILAATIFSIAALFGSKILQKSFTDFYYYEGKPYQLTLIPDAVFIEVNEDVDQSAFNRLLLQFPQLYVKQDFSLKYKKDFVFINESLNEDEFKHFINSLNSKPEVVNASPVFNMPEGEGNPNTLIGVEKEIIAQFKSVIRDSEIDEYLNQKGISIVQEFDLSGGKTYLLRVPSDGYAIDYANELFLTGLVNYSEPNLYFTNLLQQIGPNDPFYFMQWSHMNTGNNIPGGVTGTVGCDMKTDSAWLITMGSPEVIVSIVDSGIDTLHEDLHERMITGLSIDTYNNLPYAWDDHRHGTAVAGIVSATGNNNIGVIGVAPESKIFGVKIFNSVGNTSSTAIVNGLIAAWQRGSWISNNSWGGVPISAANNAISDGVNFGRNGKGVIWVFAVGNSNTSSISWPSSNENVISVGAMSPCNQRKNPFSCDNETSWGSDYGEGLEIVAPGVKIYTTDRTGFSGYTTSNYYSNFNGTSSAVPNAAGVAALVLAVDSTLTWSEVRERICLTADKVGDYIYNQSGQLNLGGWNSEMGYGRINAYKVVKLTKDLLDPPCPIDPPFDPDPTNESSGISVNLQQLNWTNDFGTTQCEVWFGESGNMNMVYSGNVITHWNTQNQLNYNTVYNWRIVQKNDTCSIMGPVWSFTTEYTSGIIFIESFNNMNYWTPIGPFGTTNWSIRNSSNAGGIQPELRLNYTPSFNGLSKLVSNVIQVESNHNYKVTLKHKLEWFTNPAPFLGLGVSYDSGVTYNSIWEFQATGNVGPETILASFSTPLNYVLDEINLSFVLYCNGNSNNIDNWYIDDIVLIDDELTFQLEVSIGSGWNIVSIPGLHPVDQNVNTWWSNRNPSTFVFSYNPTGYQTVTEVEPGSGYWMDHIGNQEYNTGDEWPAGGINIVPNDPISGNAGWNLIGGYYYNAPTSGITTTPGGLQTGFVYGYSSSGGYETTDDIIPGYGYWIELTGAGVINIPDPTFRGIQKATDRINDDWGRIIVTDNAGKSYTLYSVKGDNDLNEFRLPPVPPAGMFDIRYGSGNFAEDLSGGNQSIEMQGVQYPVQVQVQGMNIKIQDESGKIINTELIAGEKVTINNSSVNKLIILSGEFTSPTQYALEQNYPNPFNPETIIKYSIPQDVFVKISVYNLLGEKVAILVNKTQAAGRYEVNFDANRFASGIFFYTLEAGNNRAVKKMTLIK